MSASFSISGDYVQPTGVATFWRLEENKVFEVALAKHYLDADRYERIAAYLPNKTANDIQKRFRELEPTKKPKADVPANGDRRKGVPWTEEEHRLFLLGLAKFGKGDWRSIARNFVVSRTPTQVASHAQKYFIRLNSMNKKDKRRASIHDITSPTLPASVPNANPTTGLAPSGSSGAPSADGTAAAKGLTPAAAATAIAAAPAVAAATAATAAGAQSAAAAMAAAAAAAAAASSSVFAQALAMHGMAMPAAAAAAAAAANMAGMVPAMGMPPAPFMVQV
ncbi:hypothetical protein GPECTOR_160g115 [Gonium pectorale]|uniref:Uncharacterized protein n=1 Tax=Gonium pectorale TaxID=33097 RepID=A0A150FXJ2_GONPE|nr:hypothetical protein GPECTOR_160g115 [Gonium pectorale]|eukprot:KXZ42333.1 hypothetical protein GPECTOR_160g115 [Gonium pectorale]